MRFKMVRLLVVFIISVFVNAFPAQAVILEVFQDGYVEDYEKSGILDGIPDRISDTNAILAATIIVDDGTAIESRGVMTFALNPYAGKSLSSAFFTGYGTRVDTGGSSDPISADLSIYEGDGLVGLDDFNASSAFIQSLTFTPSGSFENFNLTPFQVDVKSHLQPYLSNSSQYAEFKLTSNQFTAFVNAGETHGDHTVDTRWPGPRLVLEFEDQQEPPSAAVPEPASLSLFGVGLIGLVKRLRRK